MPVPNPSIALALFEDRSHANAAVAALREAGLGDDQIELTHPDDGPSGNGGERSILSPVKTLLLGGSRASKQLYEQLVELGLEEHEARHFRDQVQQGKTLVTVISMRREHEAADLLREHGGRGALEREPETALAGGQPAIREDIASVNAFGDIRSK